MLVDATPLDSLLKLPARLAAARFNSSCRHFYFAGVHGTPGSAASRRDSPSQVCPEQTDRWPSRSYSAFTARVPVRCSTDHSNMEACPLECTNRSRLGQIGFCESKRITRFQIM